MVFEIGSKTFIIESSRIIREVTVVKRSGDFYIIRFDDGRGGIQVRSSRFYHSQRPLFQRLKSGKTKVYIRITGNEFKHFSKLGLTFYANPNILLLEIWL